MTSQQQLRKSFASTQPHSIVPASHEDECFSPQKLVSLKRPMTAVRAPGRRSRVHSAMTDQIQKKFALDPDDVKNAENYKSYYGFFQ